MSMDLPRRHVLSPLPRDHPLYRGTAQHLDLAARLGLMGSYQQPFDVILRQIIHRRQ